MSDSYSSFKIFHHPEALQAIEKGTPCPPFYIRLKPTNICNHHCSYCTYGSGNTNNKTNNRDGINHVDMIPWEKLEEIINDMGDMGVKAITFSGGGEPLSYPHILDAIRLCKKNGIELSLISNGQLLKGEIAREMYDAKWVRISFDADNKETYALNRGLNEWAFDEVITNIRDFAMHKSENCVLGINFVVNRSNYKGVYTAASLLKNAGVNNVKFSAVVDNGSNYHVDICDAVIEQIHRAQKELNSDTFVIVNSYENDYKMDCITKKEFERCYTCHLVTVIAADSKVYLCHTRAYDKNAIIGDLKDARFRDVWFSDELQSRLNSLHPQTDCLNFCAYENRNELIEEYLSVDYNHINFI